MVWQVTATSSLPLGQTPPQQSRDGYPGQENETRASFSHCWGLPGKGWAMPLFQNCFSTVVQGGSNILAAYSPCAALGRNIRSQIDLCSKYRQHQIEKLLAWAFSSVRSSRILGNLFQCPVILKVIAFSLYPVWNSHFSLCLFPLNLQPWALVQSLAHLLTATGDAVQSPEVSPSPGWASEVPEATLRANVSGTDHCDTLQVFMFQSTRTRWSLPRDVLPCQADPSLYLSNHYTKISASHSRPRRNLLSLSFRMLQKPYVFPLLKPTCQEKDSIKYFITHSDAQA